MLVTALIPVYNRRDLVIPTIESALAQTYAQLEIVVVDDGSTDGTPDAIADRFGDRVRLIRLSANRGRSAARNVGWEASRGELVALLDSDDLWLPTKLERQVPHFGDPAVVMVHSHAELMDGAGYTLVAESAEVLKAFDRAEARGFDYGGITETWTRMYPPAVVMRRSVRDLVGGFDESLSAFEDWDLFWRVSTAGRVVTVRDVLARVRVHEGNTRARWAEAAAPWIYVCEKHLATLNTAAPSARTLHARHNLLVNLSLGEYWRGDRAASRRRMREALRVRTAPLWRPWHVVRAAVLANAFLPAAVADAWVRFVGADDYRAAPWERAAGSR